MHHEFEQFATDQGVCISQYCVDNMPFHSHEFVSPIADIHQKLMFSGISTHHQNGIAECTVKTVMYWACTMMLHAVLHWPTAYGCLLLSMWFGFGIIFLIDTPILKSVRAPLLILSITFTAATFGTALFMSLIQSFKMGRNCLNGLLVPIVVNFNASLLNHSSTIGHILNLNTSHISCQYHVINDDMFSSVPNAKTGGFITQTVFDYHYWQDHVSTSLKHLDDTPLTIPLNYLPLLFMTIG